MGAPSVNVPPPTPQQNNDVNQQAKLLQEQTNILQSQFQTQQLLAPFLYQSLGLTPTLNAKGKIIGFTQDPQFAALQKALPQEEQQLLQQQIAGAATQTQTEQQFLQLQQQQIQMQKQLQPLYMATQQEQFKLTDQLFQREQQALEGKLPVDPGLITSLNEQQSQTQEGLAQNLGPGWATSTPGIQAMSKFNLNKQNILESARRGDLTMAEQLGLAANPGQFFGTPQFQGVGQGQNFAASAFSVPGNTAGTFGQLFGQAAQGYNAPLQYWQNLQGMGLQANMANAQNSMSVLSGLGGGLGQIAGMASYGALFGSPLTGGGLFG